MHRVRAISLLLLLPLLAPSTVRAQGGDDPLPPPASEDAWTAPLAKRARILAGPDETGIANTWDIAAAAGTPVLAARTGVVTAVANGSNVGGEGDAWSQDLNYVRVRHSDGSTATYGHLLRSDEPPVVGEVVLQGEAIGRAGATGCTDGPKLRLAVTLADGAQAHLAFAGLDGPAVAGAELPAAPAPRVPQATIDAYKRALRALEHARAASHPDAALVLTAAALRRLKIEDYWVHRELVRRGRVVGRELAREIDRLVELEKPCVADAVLAFRFRTVLKPFRNLAGELARLGAVVKRSPGHRTFLGGNATKFVKLLAAGTMREHSRDLHGAIESYGKASRGPDGIASASIREVRRLVENWAKTYEQRAGRLAKEAKRARLPDRAAVRRDSEDLYERAVALYKVLKKTCPTERAVADTGIEAARLHRKKINDLLR